MSTVTREVLRDELEHFAKEAIRGELAYFKNELMLELVSNIRCDSQKDRFLQQDTFRPKPDSVVPVIGSAPRFSQKVCRDENSDGYTLLKLQQDEDLMERSPTKRSGLARARDKARHWIVNQQFCDRFITAVILVNILSFVVQTDYMARNWQSKPPAIFFHIELVFLAIFMGEITLRICTGGLQFFTDAKIWPQNCFDLSLVILQFLEASLELLSDDKSAYTHTLETLRVARIFRVGRLLYFVHAFRMLLTSIISSLQTLMWIMILVFLTTGSFAVVLTQIVTDYKVKEGDSTGRDVLDEHLGTVDRAMMRLYQIVTDGFHWAELADPLMKYVSPWTGVILIIYSAFINFALMNVVAAFFVETAVTDAAEDYQNQMSRTLWKNFHRADVDPEREVSQEEFWQSMESEAMSDYFEKLGLDPDKAREMNFFKLLDKDNSGSITGEELMMGCVKLMGQARAVDLAAVYQEVREERQMNMEHRRQTWEVLDFMRTKLQKL